MWRGGRGGVGSHPTQWGPGGMGSHPMWWGCSGVIPDMAGGWGGSKVKPNVVGWGRGGSGVAVGLHLMQ